MNQSEFLPGGSGGVWRIRDEFGTSRIHRPTGPWTPAVHALLAHLQARGLDGVPKILGIDDEGREVLSYLPGETLDAEQVAVNDATLGAAAAWLRRFHDAVADFVPPSDHWRQGDHPLDPVAGEIICHNDPGLYNWMIVDGNFAGMIDWDRAGPGKPIDDLAFMCWTGVPLVREIPAADAARRLALAASEYGGVTTMELLDAVSTRMELIAHRWRVGIENKDPGTLALKASGIMSRHEERVAAFAAKQDEMRKQIEENAVLQ